MEDGEAAAAVRVTGECEECGNGGACQRCPCREAFYCNAECQRKDWPTHKEHCVAHLRDKINSFHSSSSSSSSSSIKFTKLTFILADVLVRKGRFAEAEQELQMLMAIVESVNGAHCDFYAQIVIVFGDILAKQDKYQEAVPVYKRGCSLYLDSWDWDSKVEYVKIVARLINCHDQLEEGDQADENMQKIRDIVYTFPENNPTLIRDIVISIAELFFAYGNSARYEELKKEAAQFAEKHVIETHNCDEKVYTLLDVQSLYYTDKVEECIRRCGEIIPSIIDEPYYQNELAGAYFILGQAYVKILDLQNGLDAMKKAHNLFRKTLGKNHYNTGKSMELVACILANMGRHKEAIGKFQKSTNILRKSPDTSKQDLIDNLTNLAKAYVKVGDKEAALKLANEALLHRGVDPKVVHGEEYMNALLHLLYPPSEINTARRELMKMI